MKLTKLERIEIRNMFGGRCAYCGKLLPDRFCIDHVKPLFRGWDEKPDRAGEDTKGNLFPACQRCNLHKSTLSVAQFREVIHDRLRILKLRDYNYKLAADFGLVEETGHEVVFWFEKYQDRKSIEGNK